MDVSHVQSAREWDSFVTKNKGSFLQSCAWGNFKKTTQRVWQLEARKSNSIAGVCQAFEETTPVGKYLYIPHGPHTTCTSSPLALIKKYQEIASEEKMFFVRVEPSQALEIGKKSFKRIQPQKTLLTDVTRKENEIVESFHAGTRKNIRLAERKGVFVEQSSDIEPFCKMLSSTTQRKGFDSHQQKYFSSLLRQPFTVLSYAKSKEGEVLAGNIIILFGETATCLYSANNHEKRNLKGSDFLRYKSLLMVKDKEMKIFDQWGIDDKKFPGVTRFKKGFGGEEYTYPDGVDIPLQNIRYAFYKHLSLLLKKT